MPKYEFSVAVQPHYLAEQSAPAEKRYDFSYTITVHNTGEVAAQLIARHWIIHDTDDQMREVKGLGVVGEQPFLEPGEGFQYTSGCQLTGPNGTMHGSYFCVAEDGERFEVPIPVFFLDANASHSSSTHTLH